MDRIILASASPRRKQLLEWAGLEFDVLPAAADESFPAGRMATEVPVEIARRKAAAAIKNAAPGSIILAADTLVLADRELMGKPRDKPDAIRMLSLLSGKMHQVITGVLITDSKKEIAFYETTKVWFHPLEVPEIEYYIDTFKPYDKAGAYAIQEWIGVTGIRAIEGDFYNVMGLPVSRVMQELKNFRQS
ncbi:MAG TPA: Maf family nucleotide pyrophosphatase, partial [Puia sp.]|nr:Maf family nucleotide pyrophosphatase [Puia sp.]